LSCILMLSVPVGPCDTAAIAAAVFSSSLSLGTSETAGRAVVARVLAEMDFAAVRKQGDRSSPRDEIIPEWAMEPRRCEMKARPTVVAPDRRAQ
jgi:hypothetical protein